MVLLLHELKKNYGRKEALKGINLSLSPGIYGLLGPNGAGKSTMMNILSCNLRQSSGTVTLDGEDIIAMGAAYRARLGYCPQRQALYPGFSGEQFLYYIASLQGMKRKQAEQRIDWVLELLSMQDVRNNPIRSYSGGMKQRLLLAQSFLHDPDILILDEPTAGLDPRQRVVVRNLIGQIALHKIVLISTHVVQDVDYIADELILLSHGTVIGKGTPQSMLARMKTRAWEIAVPESELPKTQQLGTVCGIARDKRGVCVRLLSPERPSPDCVPVTPTLEDMYLYHFGAEASV